MVSAAESTSPEVAVPAIAVSDAGASSSSKGPAPVEAPSVVGKAVALAAAVPPPVGAPHFVKKSFDEMRQVLNDYMTWARAKIWTAFTALIWTAAAAEYRAFHQGATTSVKY